MFTQARELRNMRLSPDPQIFYVPDLIPAVGKIQNACQRKHIVIHVPVTIIWSDVRATYARVLGEEGVKAHCHTLRPSPNREIAPGLPWRNTLATTIIARYEEIVFVLGL